VGSQPGYRRPVVIVQGDALNRSAIATVVCVPLTRNQRWALAKGNVSLSARVTSLPEDSVAVTAQITTLDKAQLLEHVGRLPEKHLAQVLRGLDTILGR